ncbi:MAG: sigma-70 family RNA polymerase sigma factor [Planctomycetaceae bacterium]|jgi:RNA polymerase primary sigma factor|nr:sigma-70 family RNA polymerase sigma factor [Planctomycetaceae bacterium]
MVKLLSKPVAKKSAAKSESKSSASSLVSKAATKAVKVKTVSPRQKRAKTSSGLPTTFQCKALEDSFVHYCQLVAPEIKSIEDLAVAVKTHLSQEIDFMGNADFSEASIESVLFADERLLPIASEELRRVKTPDLPAHLARLCETKLLTPAEEVETFRRMNFLRYKANQLRTELKESESSDSAKLQLANGWVIRRIEALLKASDWYRDRLVKSNMRLVISIVKKFVNGHNGFDDLLSDGIIALMRAVDKFDVGLGYRFSTYATQVVRRNSYRRVMEKQKERQRITLSVHDPGIDISDEHRSSGMSETRWEALRGRLSTMLDKLDRREKLIIRARFSLGGHRNVQTLQKLADRLGVSKERIRQLEKRALDKLRDMADLSPIPEVEV